MLSPRPSAASGIGSYLRLHSALSAAAKRAPWRCNEVLYLIGRSADGCVGLTSAEPDIVRVRREVRRVVRPHAIQGGVAGNIVPSLVPESVALAQRSTIRCPCVDTGSDASARRRLGGRRLLQRLVSLMVLTDRAWGRTCASLAKGIKCHRGLDRHSTLAVLTPIESSRTVS